MLHIPLPFDIFEAFAIQFCGDYHILATEHRYNPALVYYRLADPDFGFVSNLAIRKLAEQLTAFGFSQPYSDISHGEIHTLLMAYHLKTDQPLPLDYEAIAPFIPTRLRLDSIELSMILDQAGPEIARQILARREALLRRWVPDFMALLALEFPQASEQISRHANRHLGITKHQSTVPEIEQTPPSKPWEHIPEQGVRREVVRLWCQGFNSKEIAQRLSLSNDHVRHLISSLRSDFPQAKIPHHRKTRHRKPPPP